MSISIFSIDNFPDFPRPWIDNEDDPGDED